MPLGFGFRANIQSSIDFLYAGARGFFPPGLLIVPLSRKRTRYDD